MHDQNLLRNLLYNISVHPPMTKHHDMTRNNNSHYEQRSTPRTCYNYDRNTTLDHVMIITKETLNHIVHHTGLLIDHHTYVIHVLDTNRDLTPEIITSKNTLLHVDLLQDLEIPDTLYLVHTLIHEIKSIIFNHNLLQIQLSLKYTCITQQK